MAERARAVEAVGLNTLFAGAYRERRVLVTGHTGFKGSWLSAWLQAMGAEVAGLALDPDCTPSHYEQLGLVLELDARVDLRDRQGVADVLAACRPQIIFHLAAQPLVRRSYREPAATFDINTGGLVNLYEAVRACRDVQVVVTATTDKVYESTPRPHAYREQDPLGAHDPYSASKACAELISISYRRSYFDHDDGRGQPVRLATARAGNVVGGGDWAQDRLVPDLVRAVMSATPLRLRNPRATRPWQHVLEPLSGYLLLGQRLLRGDAAAEAWNFGPAADATIEVGEVVRRMQRHWDGLEVHQDPGPHPHEAAHLALDCSKAQQRLGWQPVWDADTTLGRTLEWYRALQRDGTLRSMDDLHTYIADARRAGLTWAA